MSGRIEVRGKKGGFTWRLSGKVFRDYLDLLKIKIKGQISYRKSYLVEILGQFLGMGTHIGGIFFLFHHI